MQQIFQGRFSFVVENFIVNFLFVSNYPYHGQSEDSHQSVYVVYILIVSSLGVRQMSYQSQYNAHMNANKYLKKKLIS